jgi:hypothetical protein
MMALQRVAQGVLAGVLLACAGVASAIEFTSNTSISSSAYAGEEIIVTGCILTIDCSGGPANYASMLVRSNGMVTHPAQAVNGLWLNVAGDAEIVRGSSVSANARGYPSQSGPGAGVSGIGASHGGVGGNGGAPVYGSVQAPDRFGSGGGNTPGNSGGAGGGRIRLSVVGTLTVAGGLTADGAVTCGGGGSGGSIHIEAGSVTGGGRVSADGSSCTSPIYTHGGGGGGRIAIYYGAWTYTGALSAAGGPGTSSLIQNNGGPGTVYRKPYAAPGTLEFDNGATVAWTTHPAPIAPDAVTILRAARVRFDCSTGPAQIGGLLLTGSAIVTCPAGSEGGLQIEASGDVTVESGSVLEADGSGFASDAGPGGGSAGAGGSHGGRGGAGGADPYGRVLLPDLAGSGGGSTAGGPGGSGGGVLRVVSLGAVRVDGAARSDGLPTAHGGGGAGGSIRIGAASLIGVGLVSASGGRADSATYHPGGGGGGRISLHVPAGQASFPLGAVSVAGGTGTGGVGGAGSLVRAETWTAPDMAFLDDACTVSRQPDGTWVARLTAANHGLVEALSVRVELFDGDPARPATKSLAHAIVARIAPLCVAAVEITTAPADPEEIWAALDPQGAIAEGREDNNRLVFRLGPMATSLYVPDRAGVITETAILRAYLTRTATGEPLSGMAVTFSVDAVPIGSASTGVTGRADLFWTIPDGPHTRALSAAYGGDGSYRPSSDAAVITCETHATKMSGVNREGRITSYRILKAWLFRADNTPVVGKSIAFKLDGTLLGSDDTRSTGLAQIGYTIADGAGAGVRTILAEWAGDGGYLASSCTNTLTVLKATPYIWVMPRSVPQGGIARLYAYFRRLADYQKQAGKPVTWRVDGTWVADMVTGTGADAGIARYSYTVIEPPGAHTMRCEFAGDAWVDAGHGEGNLAIY